MLCLKKRRTYSFTQGACVALPRRLKKDNNHYEGSLNMAITTLPRNNRSSEKRPSRMVLTVTEDTPADMLAGSMEILVQMPRDHHLHTQRVTVSRSTPMMDLLVQIATAHKLPASSYTLQAIGERGLILPHHPNTPIGALDVLQVKLLPKQGTCMPRKTKQSNQPFETTFRLQVHMPRNQLYVSRVSPKMNLGKILDEVCREKNLDRNKYELRHPGNLEETLDLSLSLQDYHLQEVTLYAKQAGSLRPTLSTQDIMALQRQEERHRQQTKQSVFGFVFKKSKESSLSTDSLAGRSASPARSDETARSASPLQPPARPQRKKRPAPKPPTDAAPSVARDASSGRGGADKTVINHSRNSSDSSGYHEASVLSDNLADSAARLPETLPRRSRPPAMSDATRKLAQTSQSSKSLGNLTATGATLGRGISNTSLSSTGLRKKRAAPPPPAPRPLSSAISTQALERIVDSEESLTSDMDPSKPPSDIGAPSKANSDIGVSTQAVRQLDYKPRAATRGSDGDVARSVAASTEACSRSDSVASDPPRAAAIPPVEAAPRVEQARVAAKKVGEPAPLPTPRKVNAGRANVPEPPRAPRRKVVPLPVAPPRVTERDGTSDLSRESDTSPDALVAGSAASPGEDRELAAHTDPGDDRAFAGEDRTRDEEPNVVESNAAENDARSRSSQDREARSDSELRADTEDSIRATAGETESKSQDEVSRKFIVEEPLPDITDAREENHEAPDSSRDSSREGDTGSRLSSAELTPVPDVAPEQTRERTPPEEVERDLTAEPENVDSHGENRPDDASVPSSDDRPEVGAAEAERATEPKNEPAGRVHACQGPPRAPRRAAARRKKTEESAETTDAHPGDARSEAGREPCTVISTIPKCDHLDATTREDGARESARRRDRAEDVEPSGAKRQAAERNAESSGAGDARNAKRTRVARSQSKSDDFETDSTARQRRHLTSPAGEIAHALNLNVPDRTPSDAPQKEQVAGRRCTASCKTARTTRDVDVDKKEADSGAITAADPIQDVPSETEILLQKVSDTLSGVLPARLPGGMPPAPEASYKSASVQTSEDVVPAASETFASEPVVARDEPPGDAYGSCVEFPVESALNVTDSQQDTSDYVSAMGEDLSIGDWEYQLPAPPSAFRDTHSPVLDDYDAAVAQKPPAKVDGEPSPVDATDSRDNKKNVVESAARVARSALGERASPTSEAGKPTAVGRQTRAAPQRGKPPAAVNSDPRKDVISELENKLEHGAQTCVAKDPDRRNLDDLAAPRIAPVDNTLSNFTITTYTKEKSLDIFEELEMSGARNTDERFLKTFATLSRSNAAGADTGKRDKENATAHLTNGVSHDKRPGPVRSENNRKDSDPRTRGQNEHRWQNAANANVQRSKSYVSTGGNMRYQAEEINGRKPRTEIADTKEATSVPDWSVADVPRSDEKLSRYRNNILRQEEPTKEKQLQSLQVLKSILPQLKNAQQSEENMSKEYAWSNERTRYKAESNEHSSRTNVFPAHESRDAGPEYKEPPRKEDTKRYAYAGPPAISLGSWSERPSVNVQIKMDTDYKLGSNSARTLVSINDAKSNEDAASHASKFSANKKPDELAKKLVITPGFQVSMSSRVDATKTEDRPVVMGVELKKTPTEASYPRETSGLGNGENGIDATTDFRELKKTFGQQVNLRQKPKRVNVNRQSADCHDAQPERISDSKPNGHAKFARMFDESDLPFKSQTLTYGVQQDSRARKFAPVRDVNGTSQAFGTQNETSFRYGVNNGVKITPPMPVVKGFKMPAADPKAGNNHVNYNHNRAIDSAGRNAQAPKTTPVITGVTLKSVNARPNSMPVQLNSRDMLLESIRNFGREKLKSTAERC